MAKTKHNSFLDTVDQIFTDAKNKGVFHLYTEDESFTGRHLRIRGRKLCHFGTTGYLGLEQDQRLKQAAIDAILKYGTQFPLSKTFVSFVIYKELEESLYRMYETPVLVAKNSTLCHQAVIPGVVRDEDVVILDHQVHNSVQSACQLLKPRGIKVEMIRHSNLNMLEDRIKELRNKYNKIWYMIDGVYSMFGDFAPLPELMELMNKYPSFHVYADDVHGMSWAGKHGTGYVMSKVKTLPEKMVLVATLSKSFGASGGIMTCANKELVRYVKNFGGPLSFSAQLEPASVAAAAASAKIHLSEEIYEMQQELSDKIEFCNNLLKKANIPVVEMNGCPVFYIPTGLPSSGYNMATRIMNEGFYVNMGIFPAVPIKNTGIRFTVSRHNQYEDIEQLVNVLGHHYTEMLAEEGRSENEVRKAFNLPLILDGHEKILNKGDLKITHERTIMKIDRVQWDALLGDRGIFDFDGLKFLETAFSGNQRPEENWDFHYLIIKDNNDKIIAATFFTVALWKEDMMSLPSVSEQIERERIRNPYYLTSKAIMMGALISEGNHLYIDRAHPKWKNALRTIFDIITDEQEKCGASLIMLRDFEDNDAALKEFLTEQGFLKVTLPDSCVVEELNWVNMDQYIESLSAKSRRHLRTDVLRYEQAFRVEIRDKSKITNAELMHYIELFNNVKSRNFDINTFNYPVKFFESLLEDNNWELITLSLNPTTEEFVSEKAVAVAFTYRNAGNNYNGVFLGLDYNYSEKYKTYRQVLYQAIKRAKSLNAGKVYLGLSASIEKKKFGARIIPKVAYVQAKDNFNIEFIETITGTSVKRGEPDKAA